MDNQTALETATSAPRSKVVISSEVIWDEIKSFFIWWYVEIPTWYIGFLKRVLTVCDDTFSISLLIKTFFVPWHRDYSWMGYGFGIVMRILYLPLALFITAIVFVILLIVTILWALLPILSILFLLGSPFV